MGFLSPAMLCTNSSEELTVGAKIENRKHGNLQKATEKSVELVDVTEQ